MTMSRPERTDSGIGAPPRGGKRARAIRGSVGWAIALLVAPGLFGACGQTTAPAKEPEACKLQMVNLTILASPRINQADNGEPRPVQLRLYQLATDVRLNNSTFDEVWKDDKTALKEDLIKSEQLTVYPDSRTDIRFERDEKAMVLGAAGLFRQPKGRSWYTTLELAVPPGKGACTASCPDGNCADGGAPKQNPRYVLWVDGSKVDEGSDHIDDYPTSGRGVEMTLPFAPPAHAAPAATQGGS
jgi:type VI secretion system protein VasD